MNFRVAFKITEFTSGGRLTSPYSKHLTMEELSTIGTCFAINVGEIESMRIFLSLEKFVHRVRYCLVASDAHRQLHTSEHVSRKLCLFFWSFSGLRPTRSCNSLLMPLGSYTLKVSFLSRLTHLDESVKTCGEDKLVYALWYKREDWQARRLVWMIILFF